MYPSNVKYPSKPKQIYYFRFGFFFLFYLCRVRKSQDLKQIYILYYFNRFPSYTIQLVWNKVNNLPYNDSYS